MEISKEVKAWSARKMLRLNGFKEISFDSLKKLSLSNDNYKNLYDDSIFNLQGIWVKCDKKGNPLVAFDLNYLKVYNFNNNDFYDTYAFKWVDLQFSLPLYLAYSEIGSCKINYKKENSSVDDKRLAVLLFLMFKVKNCILPDFNYGVF